MHARFYGKGFSRWLDTALKRLPVREAPFKFAVAAELSRISLPQADFGDVLLVATASILDLMLVTSDSQLLACNWLRTLSNK